MDVNREEPLGGRDRYEQNDVEDYAASDAGGDHFRSLQRVEELNESMENLNSARSQNRGGLQYTLALSDANNMQQNL